jgi:hypothetical protein
MNGLERSQFYGRMFAPTKVPLTAAQEADLVTLGKAMRDAGLHGNNTAPAGITYFGQFVDHDLTQDTTSLGERDVEPHAVRNYRTPRFDLELVYGQGPKLSPQLYEQDQVRLKIGRTAPSGDGVFPGGTLRDIARMDDATPLHADPDDTRNLENIIVMQIHVLFIKFHNAAVEQCGGPLFAAKFPLNADPFTRAQQVVRWHYQYLVRKVLTSWIAHKDVRTDVLANGPRIQWHEDDGLFIPAEFSMAAYRFGHSMVRAEYGVNAHHPHVSLAGLMARGDPPERLREDWLVEWGRLFHEDLLRSGPKIPSMTINTAIAEPLHHLPEHTKRQFCDKSEEPQPGQLPTRTLLRGARAGLPTGQEVAQKLVDDGVLDPALSLNAEQLVAKTEKSTSDNSGQVLASSNWIREQTPLYYYLLKEAEVLGSKNFTLGPIGSRIVVETFETILQHDSESYIRTAQLGPNWLPPAVWHFRDGPDAPQAVRSFRDLVKLVGDDLPQGCSPQP